MTNEVVDPAFDSFGQGKRFTLTGYDDDDFSGVQDSRDTDGESHTRYGVDISTEEASIGENGVICESFDACSRTKGRACCKRIIMNNSV